MTRSKVRYTASSHCEAFCCRSRRVFAFWLHENDLIAPQVLFAIGDSHCIVLTHHGRRGDWVGTGTVGNVGFYPGYCTAAIIRCRDARVAELFGSCSVVTHILRLQENKHLHFCIVFRFFDNSLKCKFQYESRRVNYVKLNASRKSLQKKLRQEITSRKLLQGSNFVNNTLSDKELCSIQLS